MKHLLICGLLGLFICLLGPAIGYGLVYGQSTDPVSTTGSWNSATDPTFNPNDPSTWPPSYDPSKPGSLSLDPNNVPNVDPNGEHVGDDGTSGSSSFGSFIGQKVGTYADKVKSDVENLIGEYEDQILQGLTDALEGWLMSQLQSLLGASPLRSVEALKKLMKDAYTKQQKIDYQQLKVDFAEQKGNTELSAGFGDYYKTLHLKEHAQAVEFTINQINTMAESKVFTANEKSQLQAIIGGLSDMSDIVNEVKFATNHSSSTAYMAEADRIRTLDEAYKRILDREKRAQSVKAKIKAVFVYRMKDAQRDTTLDDLIGTADTGGNDGSPRVRRIK